MRVCMYVCKCVCMYVYMYGMVVWYGMVWCGIVWYGIVWYGMVWPNGTKNGKNKEGNKEGKADHNQVRSLTEGATCEAAAMPPINKTTLQMHAAHKKHWPMPYPL